MDKQELLSLVLVILLPSLFFTTGILFFRSKTFRNKKAKTILINLFNKQIVLSKRDIIVLFFLILYFSWLNFLLPLPLSIGAILLTIFSLPIASATEYDSEKSKQTTDTLLKSLSEISLELENIKQHFSTLKTDLSKTQSDVDKTQKIKSELEKEIAKSAKDASEWANMTKEQQNLVSTAAVNAISKKLKKDFWVGLVFGLILNLVATIIWTFFGNPGRDELISKIKKLFE